MLELITADVQDSRISNQPSPTANPQHTICNIVSNVWDL